MRRLKKEEKLIVDFCVLGFYIIFGLTQNSNLWIWARAQFLLCWYGELITLGEGFSECSLASLTRAASFCFVFTFPLLGFWSPSICVYECMSFAVSWHNFFVSLGILRVKVFDVKVKIG